MKSKTLTNQAGKALCGWMDDQGGLPPVLSSIRSSPELIDDFRDALFSDDTENRWSNGIRDLLTASLLRHYEEFISVIEEHPDRIYEDNGCHKLVDAVNNALRVSNADLFTFAKWCQEVKSDFATKNWHVVPIELLSSDEARRLKVDSRPVFAHLAALQGINNATFAKMLNIEAQLNQLVLNDARTRRENQEMRRENQEMKNLISRMADALEIKHSQETDEVPSQKQGIKLFSQSNVFKKDLSLEDSFYESHVEQCIPRYLNELKSSSYKKKDKKAKDSIRRKYKTHKKVVKTILYFCPEYPPPIPQDSTGLVEWKKSLKKMTKEAVAKMRKEIPNPPKLLTPSYIEKSSIVKDWDKCKKLPKNTPKMVFDHFIKDEAECS